MANDDTLFTRRTEQEIDEALAWLENAGSDKERANSILPKSKKSAFDVLPTWLKMDLHLKPQTHAESDAPRVQNDNLSWLDSIASGLGGPLEEPPTMSWEETAIYHLSDQERRQALSDATSAAQDQMEEGVIDNAVANAALEAAQQLENNVKRGADKASPALDATEDIEDEPTVIGNMTFPLSEDEVAEIYQQIERDFADHQAAFDKQDELAEPLDQASERIVFDENYFPSDLLLPIDVDESVLNQPLVGITGDEGGSSESLLRLSDEIRSAREAVERDELSQVAEPEPKPEQVQDQHDMLTQLIVPDTVSPEAEPAAEYSSTHNELTEIYLPELDDKIESTKIPEQPDLAAEAAALTEIYLPDSAELSAAKAEVAEADEEVALDAVALTEIYLPDSAELNAAKVDAAEVDEAAAAANDLTEIYLPQAVDTALEAKPLPTILNDVDDITQIYLPDQTGQLSDSDSEDLTQLYPPEEFVKAAAQVDPQEDVTQIFPPTQTTSDDLTEIYLLDEQPYPVAADYIKAADNVAESALTDIYLPEHELDNDTVINHEDVAGNEPTQIGKVAFENADFLDNEPTQIGRLETETSDFAGSEPTQIHPPNNFVDNAPTQISISDPQVKDSGDHVAQANLAEPTMISRVSITDRWKSLRRPVSGTDSAENTPVARAIDDDSGSIADSIPEDPDEAMAWLEKMAGRNPVTPIKRDDLSLSPKIKSVLEDITQTTELSVDEVAKKLAEMQQSKRDVLAVAAEMLQDDVGETVVEQEPAADVGSNDITQISQAASLDMVTDLTALGLSDDELLGLESAESLADLDGIGEALAWIEDSSGEQLILDDTTIELDPNAVARLLEQQFEPELAPEPVAQIPVRDVPVAPVVEIVKSRNGNFDDQPTLITDMPDITEALSGGEPTEIQHYDEGNELDEALAWLKAFADDEDESPQRGALAAQALQHVITDETVAPVYESERLAAHKAFKSANFSAIWRNYSAVLAQQDHLGADLVARDTKEWIEQYPSQPKLFQLLGEAYLQLGKYESAAVAFKRALSLR